MYHDGQFDDARLAVTLAADRRRPRRGAALNYVPVTGLLKTGGAGQRRAGVATARAAAEYRAARRGCVINATGVFADAVRRMDEARPSRWWPPSQGVHLVLDRSVPAGRHGDHGPADRRRPRAVRDAVARALVVGTTDTPVPRSRARAARRWRRRSSSSWRTPRATCARPPSPATC